MAQGRSQSDRDAHAEYMRAYRRRHADRLQNASRTPEAIERRRATNRRYRLRTRGPRPTRGPRKPRRTGPSKRELASALRDAMIGEAMATSPTAHEAVLSLSRVAHGVAKRFRANRPRHEWDDLHQVAFVGVIEAVALFKGDRYTLAEFAYIVAWRAMARFLRKENRFESRIKLWEPEAMARIALARKVA